MDDDHPFDFLSGLFLLARETRRQIAELMADEHWAAHAGFRPPCMGVLAVVEKLQPVSQREISDQLGLDASDVVGVLDVLEAASMVERGRDPADRRRHAVVLTDAGAAAASRFACLRAEAEARVLAHLDPDEQRTLVGLLRRATEGLTTSGRVSLPPRHG